MEYYVIDTLKARVGGGGETLSVIDRKAVNGPVAIRPSRDDQTG